MTGLLASATTVLLAASSPTSTPTEGGGSGSGASGDGGGGGSEGVQSFSDAVDTAIAEVEELVSALIAAVPRFLIGLVVFAIFYVVARVVKRILKPRLADLKGESVARVFSGMASGAIIGVGALILVTVTFPSVDIATLLGAGGFVALAAGFAFQDILENLMAGILLLIRQPFEEGDVVDVDGAVGVVEAITVRETRIRRFDRQEVVVPNSQVYSNAIRIQTNRDGIRSSVIVGVGYDDDLQRAEEVAVEALRATDGVLDDPAPEAFFVELGGSSINLDLRYYHGSGQHELRRVQGEVVKSIARAFDENGIDIPYPIVTLDAMDDVSEAARALARDGRPTGDGGGDDRGDDGRDGSGGDAGPSAEEERGAFPVTDA